LGKEELHYEYYNGLLYLCIYGRMIDDNKTHIMMEVYEYIGIVGL